MWEWANLPYYAIIGAVVALMVWGPFAVRDQSRRRAQADADWAAKCQFLETVKRNPNAEDRLWLGYQWHLATSPDPHDRPYAHERRALAADRGAVLASG
jgi:hypothetical protein